MFSGYDYGPPRREDPVLIYLRNNGWYNDTKHYNFASDHLTDHGGDLYKAQDDHDTIHDQAANSTANIGSSMPHACYARSHRKPSNSR